MNNEKIKNIDNLLSYNHPNSKIFVISDHHFFHKNIINYERTNFNSVIDMHNYMIEYHNRTITNNDVVIFLGDFSFKTNEIKDILSKLNGHKYLLLGNHDDKKIVNRFYNMGFSGVFTNSVIAMNKLLSHHPILESKELNEHLIYTEFVKKDIINYHGHTHTFNLDSEKHINMSAENINYTPQLLGTTTNHNPDFVNSKQFNEIINEVSLKSKINLEFLIQDFLYNHILCNLSKNREDFFVYGSYPFYKKYGKFTNFSDLDIGVFKHDLSIKSATNVAKNIANKAYSTSNNIDYISNNFIKKTKNLIIFESSFINKHITTNIYIDINLVLTKLYKKSDFINLTTNSELNKLSKKELKIELPNNNASFFTFNKNVDISTLLLQLLYQQNNYKNTMSLKKLNFIYEKELDLENIMLRYFLRNVLFLDQLNRKADLVLAKEILCNYDYIKNKIPNHILNNHSFLVDEKSEFNIIGKEILNSNNIKKDIEKILTYIKR